MIVAHPSRFREETPISGRNGISHLSRLSNLAFGVVSALGAALLVLLVLVLSGRLVSDPQEPVFRRTPVPAVPARASKPKPKPIPAPKQARRPAGGAAAVAGARTRIAAMAAHEPVRVRITAVRGDCWVSARAGAPGGRLLFTGILARGESRVVTAPRVLLELGAAGNVDVTVDGRPLSVPSGTTRIALS